MGDGTCQRYINSGKKHYQPEGQHYKHLKAIENANLSKSFPFSHISCVQNALLNQYGNSQLISQISFPYVQVYVVVKSIPPLDLFVISLDVKLSAQQSTSQEPGTPRALWWGCV